MMALTRALLQMVYATLNVPVVVAATANGTSIDLTDYEGVVQVLISTGAAAGSGILNWTLQDSADNSSFATVTGWQTSGVTPNTAASNQTFAYPLDCDSVRRYIRLNVTLVSGTSLAACVALGGFKKVA